MKYLEAYGMNLTNDDQLRYTCKKLFDDIFDEKFNIYGINITGQDNDFYLNVKFQRPINNITYVNFKDLFDFIVKLDINFLYRNDELELHIFKMEDFIKELKNIKSYNL